MAKTESLNKYFSGERLYGDNFNEKDIKKWFKDEKEGYSGLMNTKNHVYGYHQINKTHGFNKLKKVIRFKNVLGFGSARGEEFLPIIDKIDKITIIEPSKKLISKKLGGKKIKYIPPKSNGGINLPDGSFDLIASFGTLHHIPNVSSVLKELSRVLKPTGHMLIREPIVSMGDWTKKRKGLTKRERGIPLDLLRKILKENDLEILSERKIMFPILRRMEIKNHRGGNSRSLVLLDYLISLIFSWNNKYHATKFIQKLRPQNVFFVLRKSK